MIHAAPVEDANAPVVVDKGWSTSGTVLMQERDLDRLITIRAAPCVETNQPAPNNDDANCVAHFKVHIGTDVTILCSNVGMGGQTVLITALPVPAHARVSVCTTLPLKHAVWVSAATVA